MVKQALCFEKNEAFQEFNQGKSDKLPACFVPREICEAVENNMLQIIPYVVFYYVDFAGGKLNFFSYTRASGITEERLKDKISLGVGGHIDSVADVVCDDVTVTPLDEEGTAVSDVYHMNAANLKDTVIRVAQREVREELGDIAIIEKIAAYKDSIVVFNLEENDVDKVHACYMVPVQLTLEEMQAMLENTAFNKEEVASISVLPLNFKFLLEGFNFDKALDAMMAELAEKFDIEAWSNVAIYIVTTFVFNIFNKAVTYDDFVKALVSKLESEAVAEPMAVAESQVPAADSEAVVVVEDTVAEEGTPA